jgi:hypothetical protein
MCLRPAEQRTIDDFCALLTRAEHRPVSISETPDCANQGRSGCDALIDRGGVVCAAEHTSLNSFHGQRHDDAAFGQVIRPLEEAIRARRPGWEVIVGVPVRALPTERTWREALPALREVFLSEIESLVDGERRMVTVGNPPFETVLTCRRTPGATTCFVMRLVPDDLARQLADRMADRLRAKRQQLHPYFDRGMATILLIESDDVALTNRHNLAEAFAIAARRATTDSISEVYIAQSSRTPIWFYPVKLDGRFYPALPEFDKFFLLQCERDYGPLLPT